MEEEIKEEKDLKEKKVKVCHNNSFLLVSSFVLIFINFLTKAVIYFFTYFLHFQHRVVSTNEFKMFWLKKKYEK